MTPRRQHLLAVLSIACLAAPLLGGCAAEAGDDDSMMQAEDEMLDLSVYNFVEMPVDESIEPTGQTCSQYGAIAPCLDGMSGAFCGVFDEQEMSFGECIPVDEIVCTPGDTDILDDDLCPVDIEIGCAAWDGVPAWSEGFCEEGGGEEGTPLVLRFDSAPITMISADATPAASFDIDVRSDASSCVRTDWPTAATPWLALDLDHNGSIDNGRELFGSGTRLASGERGANGFIALAQHDLNRDGRIDAADPVFSQLLLWRDHDADRLSSPGELELLSESGVTSLPVEFLRHSECDERGNCGVERGLFEHAGGRGELVDVHLACQ